jgi:hypothetical protein
MPSWLRGPEGRPPAGSPRQTSAATSPNAPSIPAPKAASPPRLAPEQVRTLLMGFTWVLVLLNKRRKEQADMHMWQGARHLLRRRQGWAAAK